MGVVVYLYKAMNIYLAQLSLTRQICQVLFKLCFFQVCPLPPSLTLCWSNIIDDKTKNNSILSRRVVFSGFYHSWKHQLNKIYNEGQVVYRHLNAEMFQRVSLKLLKSSVRDYNKCIKKKKFKLGGVTKAAANIDLHYRYQKYVKMLSFLERKDFKLLHLSSQQPQTPNIYCHKCQRKTLNPFILQHIYITSERSWKLKKKVIVRANRRDS